MESVAFFFYLRVHTKEKTIVTDIFFFFGAFTFWPAYKQSCAFFFRKLEDEETIKATKKKKLDASAWGEEAATQEVGRW